MAGVLVDGYVAVVDVLGFKHLLRTQDPIWIHENVVEWLRDTVADLVRYHNLETAKDRSYTVMEGGWDGVPEYDVHFMFFADTAIFYVPYDFASWHPGWGVRTLSCILSRLLQRAFQHGILLRGAISEGKFAVDRDGRLPSIVGRCVADAVELERQQEWIGISVCPGTLRPPDAVGEFLPDPGADKPVFQAPESMLVGYRSPRKPTPEPFPLGWAVAWVAERQRLDENLLSTSDLGKAKVQNTISFMDFLLSLKSQSSTPSNWLNGWLPNPPQAAQSVRSR